MTPKRWVPGSKSDEKQGSHEAFGTGTLQRSFDQHVLGLELELLGILVKRLRNDFCLRVSGRIKGTENVDVYVQKRVELTPMLVRIRECCLIDDFGDGHKLGDTHPLLSLYKNLYINHLKHTI